MQGSDCNSSVYNHLPSPGTTRTYESLVLSLCLASYHFGLTIFALGRGYLIVSPVHRSPTFLLSFTPSFLSFFFYIYTSFHSHFVSFLLHTIFFRASFS